MELLNLSCNKCGAPLNVPTGTNFVTCSYCKSQLAVHIEGGAVYTEILGQIDQKTTQILDQVNNLVDLTKEAGPYHWELGEVLWRFSPSQELFKKYIQFIIMAQGARGQYIARESYPVLAKVQKLTPQFQVLLQKPEAEAELDQFCQDLLDDDWEEYDRGQMWYSRKFRRRFR